jgi:hypothetical protein
VRLTYFQNPLTEVKSAPNVKYLLNISSFRFSSELENTFGL